MSNIAICISTWNRPQVLLDTVARHLEYLPEDARLFIVEDGEAPSPAETSLVTTTLPVRMGIAAVKNKCLELAMATDAEHIFLFDDDTRPISADWWKPYVQSKYPHLCYTFSKQYESLDKNHKKHRLGNGCMLYVRREVINKIGGFDTTFGIGKYEHNHFSWRAYAAELIPDPYIDVIGSNEYLYCLDQDKAVERTISSIDALNLVRSGAHHFNNTRMTTDFINYKL